MKKRKFKKEKLNTFKVLKSKEKVRKLSFRTKLGLIISSFIPVFGLIFFAFGCMMFFLELSQADKNEVRLLFGKTETKGKIVAIEKTDETEYYQTVKKYTYSFDFEGRTYTGTSYDWEKKNKKNDIVTIQFKKRKPEISHMKGARRTKSSAKILFFAAIFPTVGFLIILISTLKVFRQIKIIEYGKIAYGTIYKITKNSFVKGKPIYSAHFNFKADDGKRYKTIASTREIEKLKDEEKEPILYMPENPKNAILVDTLPNNIRKLLEL